MTEIINLARTKIRKINIVGCHLHKWQGIDCIDVANVFKEQGIIQLDPLNPAGRSHDIFFSARIKNYKLGEFEKTVYKKKLVFEAYFGSALHAIYKDYFPYFYTEMEMNHQSANFKKRYNEIEKDNKGIFEAVYNFVEKNGPCTGSDLLEMDEVDVAKKVEYWKTSRVGSAALDFLWRLGKLAIVERDENFRKKYDVIENYIEKQSLRKETLNEIKTHQLLLKLKSTPILSDISAKMENNTLSLRRNKQYKLEMFAEDENQNRPFIAQMNESGDFFIIPPNWQQLLKEEYDDVMRAISPLDPLIKNRDLTELLFNFDYVWEVYHPKKKRRWGYYVYPLLYQDKLIGRLEAKYDKRKHILRFFNFQKEDTFTFEKESKTALEDLLIRWKKVVNAEKISKDSSIPV